MSKSQKTTDKQSTKEEKLTYLKSFAVDYVFLAEFDIDKGCIIKLQYPKTFYDEA